LLQGLHAGEVDLVADRLIHKARPKGGALFLQGQPASRQFVLERGRVRLIDPEHRYRAPEPRGAGAVIGGLSFLTGGKHTKTGVTTE
jgi:hypothetical protein